VEEVDGEGAMERSRTTDKRKGEMSVSVREQNKGEGARRGGGDRAARSEERGARRGERAARRGDMSEE